MVTGKMIPYKGFTPKDDGGDSTEIFSLGTLSLSKIYNLINRDIGRSNVSSYKS